MSHLPTVGVEPGGGETRAERAGGEEEEEQGVAEDEELGGAAGHHCRARDPYSNEATTVEQGILIRTPSLLISAQVVLGSTGPSL